MLTFKGFKKTLDIIQMGQKYLRHRRIILVFIYAQAMIFQITNTKKVFSTTWWFRENTITSASTELIQIYLFRDFTIQKFTNKIILT